MALRISIVIPSLNGTTLPRALDAIADKTRQPDEVIVVGRDEAGDLKRYPHVHFIDTGARLCAAGARNWGIKAAQGDVTVFTDADCIPAKDWLAQHERCQVAGEKVFGGSVTACIYAKPILWRYWLYLPIVHGSKIVYCVGAADTVRNGPPER